MKKIIAITFFSLFYFSAIIAQHRTSMQVLPVDSMLRYGVLENGMAYYIQQATQKKGVADFRLVQKTGSLVEEDNERGMAHFLEHMMFKGTKHFPGQSLLDFLRRNGVAFGNDVNAFTKFENTIYMLTEVPLMKKEMMDSCLTILHDWSTDALIQPEALESERNVIVEEWRGLSQRATDTEQAMKLYEGTRYFNRNPIGDMEVIKTCTPEQMRAFYHKWYQPQHQCVIVTGDINVDEVESKIRRAFSDLKRGTTVLPDFDLPQNPEQPRVSVMRDKNQSMATVNFIVKHPLPSADESMQVGFEKQKRALELALRCLNNWFTQLREANPSIFWASTAFTDFISSDYASMAAVSMISVSTNYRENLSHVLAEIQKAKQYGFTEEELTKGFPALKPMNERVDEDTTVIDFDHSDTYFQQDYKASIVANKLVKHFLHGTLPVSDRAYSVLSSYLETHVTPEMVRNALCRFFDIAGSFVQVTLPQDENIATPTDEEITQMLKETKEMSLVAAIDGVIKADKTEEDKKAEKAAKQKRNAAFDATIKPGKIKKQRKMPEIGCTEYTLSNGVRVILNNKPDLTNFFSTRGRAVVPGGQTLFENDEIIYATLIRGISNNRTPNFAYQKFGNPVNDICMELGASYTRYLFDISDVMTVPEDFDEKDIEDADKENWEHTVDVFRNFYRQLSISDIDMERYHTDIEILRQQASVPRTKISEAQMALADFSLASAERMVALTPELVESVSPEKMKHVLNRLHANYNGMTLLIRTSKDPRRFLPLIKKYVASLPADKKHPMQPVDRPEWHAKPYDDKHVAIIDNPTPIALVYVIAGQEGGFSYSASSVAHGEALTNVLNQLLINKIRINHSDVYSIKATNTAVQFPSAMHNYPIFFTCAPEKAEDIINDIKALLREIVEKEVITQALLDGYLNTKTGQAAGQEKRNASHLDYLFESVSNNGVVIDPNDLDVVNAVTVESLRKFAQELLAKGHIYEFIMKTE